MHTVRTNPRWFRVPADRLLERLRRLAVERDEILSEIQRRALTSFTTTPPQIVQGTSYVACGDARLFIHMDMGELTQILRTHFKARLRFYNLPEISHMSKPELINTILLAKGMTGACGFAPTEVAKPTVPKKGGTGRKTSLDAFVMYSKSS